MMDLSPNLTSNVCKDRTCIGREYTVESYSDESGAYCEVVFPHATTESKCPVCEGPVHGYYDAADATACGQ